MAVECVCSSIYFLGWWNRGNCRGFGVGNRRMGLKDAVWFSGVTFVFLKFFFIPLANILSGDCSELCMFFSSLISTYKDISAVLSSLVTLRLSSVLANRFSAKPNPGQNFIGIKFGDLIPMRSILEVADFIYLRGNRRRSIDTFGETTAVWSSTHNKFI